MLHSEAGPNINPLSRMLNPQPVKDDNINPTDFDWHAEWKDLPDNDFSRVWDSLKETTTTYSDDKLTKETLGDDYQLFFVHLVLDHVNDIISSWHRNVQPEPLRLMLLGTAGTGKTKAIQTLLQELQKTLQTMHLHVNFARAAAPTGSAAFNIRFNASTIHRLIHWLNPRFFRELKQNDKSLARFQAFMQGTQLVILDEISMVGRQFMGKIDSRLRQAKAGRNPLDRDLGGISCVCVGDTGQCEAISDQQLYDGRTHPNTIDEPSAAKVIFSNKGLGIYSSFDKVVILTTCHRLQTIENPTNDKDRAFNDRSIFK